MSEMPQWPPEHPENEFRGVDSNTPQPPVPPWRPPVDSATARKILAAALIELDSPQWTEQFYVRHGRAPNLVVGCSGGVDSVVLVHLLRALAHLGKLDHAIHVAHLDHQLRADSHLDAEFVRALAETWQLPVHTGTAQVTDEGEGLEAAARRARYDFLRRHSDATLPPSNRILITGHHADDQAETVLMHLVRGSGVEGFAAMRAIWHKMQRGDEVFRPLLRVRRADIETYARENGLPWRVDPSNLDTRFDRNLIRHEVMPVLEQLNPQVALAMERFSRIMAYEADRLKRLSRQQFERERVEVVENVRFVLSVDTFVNLPLEDQIAVLRHGVHSTFNRLWWRTTVADPGIDALESLARAIVEVREEPRFRTTGPHPWYDGLSWSTFVRPAVFGTHKKLFSIHLNTEAPWVPLGPWVEDADVALLNRSPTLPWSLTLQSGWRLTVRKLDLAKYGVKKRQRGAVWFDADAFTQYGLAVPLPGMKIAPIGMGGKHKKIADLFTDHKIPAAVRHKWPLIIDPANEEILWVSWLTQSEFGKVTDKTRQVWEFQWRPEESRDRAENHDQFRERSEEDKPSANKADTDA